MLTDEVRKRLSAKGLYFLLAILLVGCYPAKHPRSRHGDVISDSISFRSYIQSPVGKTERKTGKFYFPLLQVYDEQGRLVYIDHDASANAELLNDLPKILGSSKPLDGALPLSDALASFPQFESRIKGNLSKHRRTVIAIFLEDCHACSVQEEALKETQEPLLDKGVDILILRVTKNT